MLFTSDHMEQILHLLSRATHSAVYTEVRRGFIPHALHDLTKLETRPLCLTEIAFDWCSMICEKRQKFGDWKSLLLVSLEIGFRHLDPGKQYEEATLTHTEHHLEMVDVVIKTQKSEAIADLLRAFTLGYTTILGPPGDVWAEHLAGLHNLVPFSSRLRRLVIRSVEFVGYEGFEGVGMERFTELLNHLNVRVKDMNSSVKWGELLLKTLQASEGAQRLSHWYWELLVELTIIWPKLLRRFAYSPQTTKFLDGAQEWNKLECWMAMVWIWISYSPDAGQITEGDLDRLMLSLFRQRPGAAQKLEQWMERWSKRSREVKIPKSFPRICKKAQQEAQREAKRDAP
jgi:hypothetical protein